MLRMKVKHGPKQKVVYHWATIAKLTACWLVVAIAWSAVADLFNVDKTISQLTLGLLGTVVGVVGGYFGEISHIERSETP